MSAADGNRLREGQVVSGVLEIDPPPSQPAPPAERDAYDEVPGVFVYSTGEDLLNEIDDAKGGEPSRVATAPVTGRRHLSLWERMLEALDREFSRQDPEPTSRSMALAGEIENPVDLGRTTEQPRETDRKTDLGNSGDTASETKHDPGDGTGGDPHRGRGGLRATLGELLGVGKQSRHAR